MSVYIVTGKLGSGKTLATVGRIRDGILAGKRIATNLDLFLENILPPKGRAVQCMRLPDKPLLEDMEMIGMGNDSMDESKNGMIVLDELGTWLNARSWADKTRQEFINWLLHSRKRGWDVYFIIQHPNLIDKQIREGVAEYLVQCRRLDRMRVPFIGGIFKTITGYNLMMPKIHVASVRYGMDRDSIIADRWTYRGQSLYAGYDTRQVFTDKRDGVFSYLSPWHLKGRYLPPPLSLGFLLSLVWRVPYYGIQRFCEGMEWLTPMELQREMRREIMSRTKHPIIALLAKLPPDQALKHWHQFNELGAFD